ncbi:MAG: trypsin-like peptidase domain-containing protein [Halioglobus sp.]|nr:trypsin-like peptidase domain-containing protein [Halioglobus sp.]
MKTLLTVYLWPALAGIFAALLILDRLMLPGGASGNTSSAPVSYADAVQVATPSVVNIYTAKLVSQRRRSLLENSALGRMIRIPSRSQRIERALGSGVIMSKEGHILTNNHVIAGADAIQVMLHDGRSANAVVIGTDTATDLAALQVDLADLQPITFGDSNTARVGDVVLAIGNPLGFRHTVSQGIISGLGRFGVQSNTYEDYIQTDAIIHQGNSGGALIDVRGRLLGINTLIYTTGNPARHSSTGIGISLAIPVNLAYLVMQDLINYGEVVRGWLGVSAETIRLADDRQALEIINVAENSPAQRAGLTPGDVITHIGGKAIEDGRLTMQGFARLKPGEPVEISLLRGTQSLQLTAVVGVLNSSGGQHIRQDKFD